MGFDEGHFAFDSPTLTYYTGQIVFGKLVFNQDKVKTFRGKFYYLDTVIIRQIAPSTLQEIKYKNNLNGSKMFLSFNH